MLPALLVLHQSGEKDALVLHEVVLGTLAQPALFQQTRCGKQQWFSVLVRDRDSSSLEPCHSISAAILFSEAHLKYHWEILCLLFCRENSGEF